MTKFAEIVNMGNARLTNELRHAFVDELPFLKSFQSYYLSDIKYGHRQQHSASVRQLSAVVMPYPTPKIRGGISWMNCYGNTRTNSKV